MKKFLLILLVPIMLLAGCDGSEADLAHKEKCNRYYEEEEKQTGAYQEGYVWVEKSLSGVYWSDTQNTCVSIFFIRKSNAQWWGTYYEYYDAITNRFLMLSPYDSSDFDPALNMVDFNEKGKVQYEDSLKLLR